MLSGQCPQSPAGFAELIKVRGLTCGESYHDQTGHSREKMVWDFRLDLSGALGTVQEGSNGKRASGTAPDHCSDIAARTANTRIIPRATRTPLKEAFWCRGAICLQPV
jgi:hypothetical protein